MRCDLKLIQNFFINFCNGNLYSFDDENKNEYSDYVYSDYVYSDYEMKKKDLTNKYYAVTVSNSEINKFVAVNYAQDEINKKEEWEILF